MQQTVRAPDNVGNFDMQPPRLANPLERERDGERDGGEGVGVVSERGM